MPSRDKILPLETWNQSGVQENALEIIFLRLIHLKIYPQRIQSDDVQRNREAVPEAERTKTSHTSGDGQNQGTIPMPTFAKRPLTASSTIPVELPKNYMVGQQRQQISELQIDKYPTPASFLVEKTRFKTQVSNGSDFPSDALLWISRVKILAISLWKGFSKLRDAGREDCLCSEQDHPEFPVQEGGQPREQKAQKEDRFLRGRQIAFTI